MLRVTLPALRQLVHTFRRFGVPLTRARMRWMFGFQRRLVRTWECDTDLPKPGPLPQTSHTEATVISFVWVESALSRSLKQLKDDSRQRMQIPTYQVSGIAHVYRGSAGAAEPAFVRSCTVT